MDYFCFHHPYNKLVQKAFGRLFYMDARRGKLKKVRTCASRVQLLSINPQTTPSSLSHTQQSEGWDSLDPWVATPVDETYDDRDLETLLRGLSHDRFNKRVGPSCLVSMQVCV
jgi:3-hydroxy-3-methylglutaryl CoA synthase